MSRQLGYDIDVESYKIPKGSNVSVKLGFSYYYFSFASPFFLRFVCLFFLSFVLPFCKGDIIYNEQIRRQKTIKYNGNLSTKLPILQNDTNSLTTVLPSTDAIKSIILWKFSIQILTIVGTHSDNFQFLSGTLFTWLSEMLRDFVTFQI